MKITKFFVKRSSQEISFKTRSFLFCSATKTHRSSWWWRHSGWIKRVWADSVFARSEIFRQHSIESSASGDTNNSLPRCVGLIHFTKGRALSRVHVAATLTQKPTWRRVENVIRLLRFNWLTNHFQGNAWLDEQLAYKELLDCTRFDYTARELKLTGGIVVLTIHVVPLEWKCSEKHCSGHFAYFPGNCHIWVFIRLIN